mgnify:FL=1
MTEDIKETPASIYEGSLKKLEEDTKIDQARKPEEIEAAVKGILNRAVEFLTPRKLLKRMYFADDAGTIVMRESAKDKATQCCTAGAIMAGNGFDYGFDYKRATRAVEEALSDEQKSGMVCFSVMAWSDSPSTTKEMALEVLKKAAAEYKYTG